VENLRKIITIKSLVTFKNYYPLPVRIWQEVDGRFVELAALAKGAEWNAPLSAVYSPSAAFYLSLQGAGQNMGLEPISWKDIEPAGHCRKVDTTVIPGFQDSSLFLVETEIVTTHIKFLLENEMQ
jgi:hypothetical protein